MQTTLQSEVKQMEVIVIGSRSLVRYLPCTNFIDYDLDDEEAEDE